MHAKYANATATEELYTQIEHIYKLIYKLLSLRYQPCQHVIALKVLSCAMVWFCMAHVHSHIQHRHVPPRVAINSSRL